MARFLRIEDRGPARWVTLCAPRRRNAIPVTGWEELRQAFEEFAASESRVLVIRGEGEHFCAGADLGDDLAGMTSAAANAQRMRLPNAAATALHRIPQPTIAAVDGVAVGAGMNLALGCDVVVATDRVRFSEIFVRRGLTLDFGGTWLLPRLVGLARARELALTGREVGAEEAERIGLVARIVAPDALETTVAALAAELAEGAPLAQRFIKVALDRSSDMTFEQSLEFEGQSQAVLLGSSDLREATAAFFERRPPRFAGR